MIRSIILWNNDINQSSYSFIAKEEESIMSDDSFSKSKNLVAHKINNSLYKLDLSLRNLANDHPEMGEHKSGKVVQGCVTEIADILRSYVKMDSEEFICYVDAHYSSNKK